MLNSLAESINYLYSSFINTFYKNSNKTQYELRVSLDVGSGSTKAKGLVFDTKNGKIVDDLGEVSEILEYQSHLNLTGNVIMPDFIYSGLSKIMKIISQYSTSCNFEIGSIKCSGIATAWARNATNFSIYQKILSDNGIKVDVISQEKEGEIGYKAAVFYCKTFDKFDEKDIGYVLDIGGGSFQVVEKLMSQEYCIFKGNFGASNFFKAARAYGMDKDDVTALRYMNTEELKKAKIFVQENVINSIKEHLSTCSTTNAEKEVLAIGQFMNVGTKSLSGHDVVTKTEISQILEDVSKLSIDEANATYPLFGSQFMINAQTNLLLLEGIMEGFGIEELTLVNAKSVDYVAYDESIWNNSLHSNSIPVELFAFA